jgi:carboxymethylenebutenolidase
MKSLPPLLAALLLAGCAPQPAKAPATFPGTEEVAYPSGKDTVRGFLCRPAGAGPFPAVVLVHGDFGLTDWVQEQARRLAGKGFVILAVDLYRGQVVKDLLDAHIMDRGLPEDRVQADLRAAVDYLSARPDVRGDALGALGWGSGGGHALDASVQDPRLRAVVTCYGRLTTDAELLKPLRASVLGIFAGKDEGISRETIARFEAAMREAGKRVEVQVHPECGHGFLDPTSPSTSGPPPAVTVARAWKKIDTYLAAELRP